LGPDAFARLSRLPQKPSLACPYQSRHTGRPRDFDQSKPPNRREKESHLGNLTATFEQRTETWHKILNTLTLFLSHLQKFLHPITALFRAWIESFLKKVAKRLKRFGE
jgi:hypothetical protein